MAYPIQQRKRSLALSAEQLWRAGSQNLKSRSRDPGHAHFGGHSSATM